MAKGPIALRGFFESEMLYEIALVPIWLRKPSYRVKHEELTFQCDSVRFYSGSIYLKSLRHLSRNQIPTFDIYNDVSCQLFFLVSVIPREWKEKD